MATRRQTVIGLGGLLAAGGALVSTGAFDTVEAERSVGLETAGDANAFLSMESLDTDVVDPDAELIEFEIPGSSSVTYEELVLVTNRGTQTVTSLRFEFEVTGADQSDDDVEEALRIVSEDNGDLTEIDATREINLIAASDADDAGDNKLDPGESIPFGMKIDLTEVDDLEEISGDPDIVLRIIAESGDVEDDPGEDPDPIPEPQFVFDDGSEATGQGPGGSDTIEFTVANEGDPVDVGGFLIDISGTPDGNDPDSFAEFDVGGQVAVDGGAIGENVTHDPVSIGQAEYAIREFTDEDDEPVNMQSVLSSGEITVTLLDEEGEEKGDVEN